MSVSGKPLAKGCIGRMTDGEIEKYLVFQFNPTRNAEKISPTYSMIDPPGSAFPTAVFKSVSTHQISFRLLLDAVETYSDVEEGAGASKAFIESLARQDLDPFIEGTGKFVAPPMCLVCIGSEGWYCVLTDLSFEVVRRSRELVPTRVWADMTFDVVFAGSEYTLNYYGRLNSLRGEREVSKANLNANIPLLG